MYDMWGGMQASEDAEAMIERNQVCLGIITEKLTKAPFEIWGAQLEDIILQHGHPQDLEHREAGRKIEVYL